MSKYDEDVYRDGNRLFPLSKMRDSLTENEQDRKEMEGWNMKQSNKYDGKQQKLKFVFVCVCFSSSSCSTPSTGSSPLPKNKLSTRLWKLESRPPRWPTIQTQIRNVMLLKGTFWNLSSFPFGSNFHFTYLQLSSCISSQQSSDHYILLQTLHFHLFTLQLAVAIEMRVHFVHLLNEGWERKWKRRENWFLEPLTLLWLSIHELIIKLWERENVWGTEREAQVLYKPKTKGTNCMCVYVGQMTFVHLPLHVQLHHVENH